MLAVPAELAAAIETAERTARVRLSVDWDGDGHGPPGTLDDLTAMVAGYRLERSLDGDLPEQVRIVTGSAAAAAQITLAGTGQPDDTRSAAWWFSPLNPASPLAGKQRVGRPATVAVEFATPAGPRTVPRLTGFTRTVAVNAGRRDAALSILDNRERLRGLVPLPPIDGNRYGGNATWLITWALTVCGWTVGPQPRRMRRLAAVAEQGWVSDAALCAPMHGSLWPWFRGLSYGGGLPPNIAAFATSSRLGGGPEQRVRPTFVPGPFVLGAYAGASTASRYTVIRGTLPRLEIGNPVFEGPPVRTGRLELWVRGDAIPTPAPPDAAVTVKALSFDPRFLAVGVAADRRLFAHYFNGTTDVFRLFGPTLPNDGQWHFVGIGFQLAGTNPSVVFRLDSTQSTVSAAPVSGLVDLFTLIAFLPVAEMQITGTALATPWLNQNVVTDAVVEPSALELDAMVERDQREAWGLLRELAAAEQATVMCDEAGLLRYRTRTRPTVVAATLTAATAITDIAVAESIDAVRDLVEVPYVQPVIRPDWVWTLDTPIELGAGQTVQNWPVVLDTAVAELDQIVDQLPAAPTTFTSYLRANTAPDGGGTPINDLVSADVFGFTTTGEGRVHWSNGHTQTVYIVEARLAGRAIRTRPAGMARAEHPSLAATGGQPQPLTLPANQWVQRPDIALALAQRILADVAQPRPVITDLAIRADPRLQLGDRIRLVDRDGLGLDHHWWITGISESMTADGGYTMRITCRQAT